MARKPTKTRAALIVRWLHIYISMFGFAALFFFAVTGITLNHPDWFFAGASSVRDVEGQVEAALLGGGDAQPDKLAIVELLRARHDVRGALSDFRIDDYECAVSFAGPGYTATAFVDRATGAYRMTETRHGLVAVVNDLHKGRDTGAAWSWVIDLSAALMTFTSLSGFVLLLFLRRWRRTGLILGLIGGAIVIAVIILLVP